MKAAHGIWVGLGVVFCGLATNHQIAATREAAKMQPLDAKATAQLVARGKQIVSQKGCNTCHGAALQGKPNFAPGLRQKGVMRHYKDATFARLMAVGLTEDGEKVQKPMPVYHMNARDSAALYAYLKTQK